MKKKASSFYARSAVAVTLWSLGVAAASDASHIEKQFAASFDSSLARLAALPEVRMKEVVPFNGVAKEALEAHPEIAAIIRTNSKGIVVNCARSTRGARFARPENGETMLHADVSGRDWYTDVKSGTVPYRGALHKEKGRESFVLSRPLLINTAGGGRRFGGIVAIFLDIREDDETDGTFRVQKAASQPPPPKVQEPAESPRQSPTPPAHTGKQELYPYGDTAGAGLYGPAATARAQSAGRETAFLRIAGAIAVLLVAFCLWLIISTLRKRQSLQQSSGPAGRQQPAMPAAQPEGEAQELPLSAEEQTREGGAAQPSIEEQERKAVEREIAQKVRTEEYDAIVRSEREKLSESVRSKIAEEESASCAAEARETLRHEIYETVKMSGEEAFTALAREEIVAEIRKDLLEKEKQIIVSQQRRNIEAELYEEVSQNQRETIREAAIREITEEERQRIESGLRKTILEEEKNRIINEEAPGMRQEVRARLHDEELDDLRRTVRDEIYSQTVQAIKQNLEDKYRAVVEEKIAELNVHLKKKMKSEIRTALKEDYDRLMAHIEQLSASMTNIEALQSLSQTITLLTDEKKKYKYLNLNTAQTESLLEYLKRVQNRFNIFFDKVDESVRVLMLNLSSVDNKLDNNE